MDPSTKNFQVNIPVIKNATHASDIALQLKPISRSDHEKTAASKVRSLLLHLPGDNLVVVEAKMAALRLIPSGSVMSWAWEFLSNCRLKMLTYQQRSREAL